MKRRSFARSLCASVATLGGCTALRRPDTVEIGLAEVVNLDESSDHEVRVRFSESASGVVYDERHRLPRQTGTVPPSVVVDDALPDAQGRYELRATVDAQKEPERMDVASMAAGDCTYVIVIVRSASRVGLTATERCYDATDGSTSS